MQVKLKYPSNLPLHTNKRDVQFSDDFSLTTDIVKSILVQDFEDCAFEKFYNQFNVLLEAESPVIPIVIDSYGGEVYSLMGIIDLIKNCPVPVLTVSIGKSMSCGSILAAYGTPGYRFMSPYSTIMIHSLSSFDFGKLEDLKSDVSEAERLSDILFGDLDKISNQKKGFYKKLLKENHNANLYVDAINSQKYGLIDHIGIPTIEIDYKWAPTFTFNIPKPFITTEMKKNARKQQADHGNKPKAKKTKKKKAE